jgi:hypothetical protein
MADAPKVPDTLPPREQAAGVKVLLLADSGGGKTFSLRTFFKQVKTGFLLATEPGTLQVLGDIACTAGGNMHHCYVPAANPSLNALITSARTINQMTYQAITDVKAWAGKNEYAQFIDFLNVLAKPKCQLCGKEFPMVDTWGTDMGFAIDSLSGISLMSMDLTVGSKPAKHQGEWGVAMDNLERVINKMCFGVNCHFAMTAHVEREYDEVNQSVTLMVSSLGKKLPPKIPRYFDDVLYGYREKGQWFWGLNKSNVAAKSRHLAYADNIPQDFAPIFQAYERMLPVKKATPA